MEQSYKEKYEQALSKAKDMLNYKDEKIRKALIEHFKFNVQQLLYDFSNRDVLAWLEKQCQVNESAISQHEIETCKENDDSLTYEDERIRKEIINYFKCQTRDEPSRKDIHNKWISWLERQEGCEVIKKDWLEYIKQSWYKEGFIDGKYAEKRCLEWTQNDATILNELIDFLENKTVKLQHDLALYASWLKRKFYPSEKQGEQKPAWSEEDEKMLVDAYVMLDWYKGNNWWTARRIKDWLNSLKERIGG